jgi:hypothetical protein
MDIQKGCITDIHQGCIDAQSQPFGTGMTIARSSALCVRWRVHSPASRAFPAELRASPAGRLPAWLVFRLRRSATSVGGVEFIPENGGGVGVRLKKP